MSSATILLSSLRVKLLFEICVLKFIMYKTHLSVDMFLTSGLTSKCLSNEASFGKAYIFFTCENSEDPDKLVNLPSLFRILILSPWDTFLSKQLS